MLQVLDQALDDARVEALLDALSGLGCHVSERPSCLLSHNLLRMGQAVQEEGQNTSVNRHTRHCGVGRGEEISDHAQGRDCNRHLLVSDVLD